MRTILDMLDYQDFGSVFVALLLLWFIGRRMAVEQPHIVFWSYRITAAAMLGHAALLWIDWMPQTASAIAGIIFRSLVTGWFALNVSRIFLSALIFLHSYTLQPLGAANRRWAQRRRSLAEQFQREQEAAARRAAEQLEWERNAPERERARQLAEQRERQERANQRRREQSRLDCELFYALHAPEIHERFSSFDFADFVKRYMRDDMNPDAVAARGKQLQEIIQQHANRTEPPAKFSSLNDITAWYEQQKLQAETIVEERLRNMVRAQLKARYADLTTQLLEEVDR